MLRKINPLELLGVCLLIALLTFQLSMLWFARANYNILQAMEKATGDRWRATDHRKFIEELRRLNPNLKLPTEDE